MRIQPIVFVPHRYRRSVPRDQASVQVLASATKKVPKPSSPHQRSCACHSYDQPLPILSISCSIHPMPSTIKTVVQYSYFTQIPRLSLSPQSIASLIPNPNRNPIRIQRSYSNTVLVRFSISPFLDELREQQLRTYSNLLTTNLCLWCYSSHLQQ